MRTGTVAPCVIGVTLPFPLIGDSALGGSIPGFAAAFVLALAILPRRPPEPEAG